MHCQHKGEPTGQPATWHGFNLRQQVESGGVADRITVDIHQGRKWWWPKVEMSRHLVVSCVPSFHQECKDMVEIVMNYESSCVGWARSMMVYVTFLRFQLVSPCGTLLDFLHNVVVFLFGHTLRHKSRLYNFSIWSKPEARQDHDSTNLQKKTSNLKAHYFRVHVAELNHQNSGTTKNKSRNFGGLENKWEEGAGGLQIWDRSSRVQPHREKKNTFSIWGFTLKPLETILR